MESGRKIEWSHLEYEQKERGNDWFWALGIIVFSSSVAAFIYGNYFFGLFLIISGILLAIFAIKKPDLVFYELNEKGLKIKDRLFLFEDIQSFWVRVEDKPILFIKSSRPFLPIIPVSLKPEIAKEVRNLMLAGKVKEEEMREYPSEKIMESLGF